MPNQINTALSLTNLAKFISNQDSPTLLINLIFWMINHAKCSKSIVLNNLKFKYKHSLTYALRILPP